MSAPAQDPFGYGPTTQRPEVFLQYKGTDICFDFHCECGFGGHFDGYFASVVHCPGCGKDWQMPWHLYPQEGNPDGHTPVVPRDHEEDYC